MIRGWYHKMKQSLETWICLYYNNFKKMHEDVDLQSERALDVMINEYQIIEIPSPSNVKSIMAYVQAEEFRFFKHMLISQVYDNPNLEID